MIFDWIFKFTFLIVNIKLDGNGVHNAGITEFTFLIVNIKLFQR